MNDKVFLDDYLIKSKQSLKAARKIMEDSLSEAGVTYVKGDSTFFVWIDLRKYLKSNTFESERELYNYFLSKKIILGPGEAFISKQPGFFRLVYSYYFDMEVLKAGMERFKKTIQELK